MFMKTEPRDILTARPDGLADAIGRSLGARRPALAAVIVWVVAFVVLGAAIIGLGLLLTHVLLPAGLGAEDVSWSRWFVPERTPTLNTVTRIGSDLGSSGVILALAAVAGVALASGRYWRQLAFLFFALTLEFGVFLITTIIVDRHRPTVPQLDVAPPTSSFPSGHTASALTLYVGAAIVLTSLVRGTRARTLVWVFAILLPMGVAISRLYRGMHFPTDVAASVLLSIAALLCALLAVRSIAAAETERDRPVAPPPPADSPLEVAS
jgi:membrane-associated phospholipid phosphatase